MNVVPQFRSKSRPTRDERLLERYIGALGLCSIFVGGPVSHTPAKLGYNAEVVGRSGGGRFIIWEREWCRSVRHAQAVLNETFARLGANRIGEPSGGWFDVDVHRAHRTVHEAAKALEIPLTPNQRLQERGMEMLERVEQKIFQMNRDGSLRVVNKAFKAHRIEAGSNGIKTPNYQEFLDAYLHDVFGLIAREVFGSNL